MARKLLKLMGKKRGMTQIFDDKGNMVTCTVIEMEKNVVTQIKTKENDGYSAIQLGFERIVANDPRTAERRVGKPVAGHFKKANLEPRRHLNESLIDDVSVYQIGQEIGVEAFKEMTHVDVSGRSKGKGYAGVMKKYNFRGGPASHGSGFHRHRGSQGMRSTPGRVLPGKPQASHMGDENVTVENLKVIKIDEENNLIIVEGSVPGPVDNLVFVKLAKKIQAA